ncbi:hypothetical protein [Lacticaseibacillus daqingensis]|uniref:hypothetical protein n=1 Tax=Lacticaseibacillus daqingensis TaxID=2486014 RepID=UPI000F77A84A|nr:hypothetical protein [Lacticaseibacillus daqingensis]
MEKNTSIYQKFRLWVWLAAAVILLAIGFGVWRSNAKTDVLADYQIGFTGSNKDGSVELSKKTTYKFMKNVIVAVAKTDKLNKDLIKYMDKTDYDKWDEDTFDSLVGSSKAEGTKFKTSVTTALKMAEKLAITPRESLKNGDTVTVKLNITQAQADHYNIALKPHTFKVQGLK